MNRTKISDHVHQRTYGAPLDHVRLGESLTMAQLERSPWKLRGRCVGLPDVAWFDRDNSRETSRARGMCAGCPVRELCLAYALTFGEEYGVWGGYTAAERVPLQEQLFQGRLLADVLAVAFGGPKEAEVA